MPLYAIGDRRVILRGAHHYIAPDASVIGSVTLETDVSVWFNVVIRADNDQVTVGEASNVQDGSVLHTDPGMPLVLGKGVTIGHCVMLHGCTVGDGSLIGVGAVVLNNAVIGKNSLVGAGAVVTEGKKFEDRALIFGAPAKTVREVSEDNVTRLRMSAESYVRRGQQYKEGLKRIG